MNIEELISVLQLLPWDTQVLKAVGDVPEPEVQALGVVSDVILNKGATIEIVLKLPDREVEHFHYGFGGEIKGTHKGVVGGPHEKDIL